MLDKYSKLLKKTGSIQHRDKIGEAVSALLRQIHPEVWEYIESDNSNSIQRLAGLIKKQGIIQLPNQVSIAERIAHRCNLELLNNKQSRTIVVPTNKYIDLLIPLLLNEELLKLVSNYLTAPARIQSWSVSWNNRGNNSKEENGQLYHRDRDDFRSLRLYLYLSDVNYQNGPHYYIKASHTWDLVTEKNHGEKPDDLIDDSKHAFMDDQLFFRVSPFNKQDELCLIGKQGFCWLEDGGGLHKGSVPTDAFSSRLMLSVTWGLYEGSQYENAGGQNQLATLRKILLKQKNKLSIIQKYAIGQNRYLTS